MQMVDNGIPKGGRAMKTNLYLTEDEVYDRVGDEALDPAVDFIPPKRLSAETQKLQRAASGDLQAAASVMSYLTSSIRDLRLLMQTALHETGNEQVWRCLLTWLALGAWGDWTQPETAPARPLSWQEPVQGAAAHAIIEAYTTDYIDPERALKQRVLKEGLTSEGRIRQAAACLLGLRGDATALPALEQIIQDATQVPLKRRGPAGDWSILAVEALAAIDDPRCGPSLVQALAEGHGELHRAASRALRDLGGTVAPTLAEALSDSDSHVRWHAARALGQTGNPIGIETLVEGLHDEHPAVRWATASVLASLDAQAIPYILRDLIRQPLSEPYRQAVYHALHAMPSHHTRIYLQPLLEALQSSSASIQGPAIAQKMLAEWKSK
jgi:HEAT repeat protein